MEDKSPATYVVSAVVEHLRAWRRKKTIFRIDSEPAVQATRPGLGYSPSTESFRSEGTEQDDDKASKLRVARLERYLVGTQKLTLRFDRQEHLEMNNRARQRQRDSCQGGGRLRALNCRSPEGSEHSERSQRTSLGRVST